MNTYQIDYFAALREQSGLDGEQFQTALTSAALVYEALREKHRFALTTDDLKLAINDAFAPWDQPLADGDRLVFIPPVSGG